MTEPLCDVLPFQYQIVESNNNGRMVIEGVFQRASDQPNANGRIYKRSLWEKVLNDPKIIEAINAKRMFGALDHPLDGKHLLENATTLITSLNMQANGDIIGRAEILPTPKGLIAKALLESGVTIGISSRATGSVKKIGNVNEVDEKDFKLETFDLVANPSTPGAYPRMLIESQEDTDIKESYMTSTEKLKLLEDKASRILEMDILSLDKNAKSLVESTTNDIVIDLTRLTNESPEIKELSSTLIEELKEKKRHLKALDSPVAILHEAAPAEAGQDGQGQWTQGSSEQGWIRTMPQEAPPPQGEGWPFDPNDAGVLNGINGAVQEFMAMQQGAQQQQQQQQESEEMANNFIMEAKKKKKKNPFGQDDSEDEGSEGEETEDEGEEMSDEKEKNEAVKQGLMTSIAQKMVQLEETPQTRPLKAFAAAYLLEQERRLNEAGTFKSIITKLQEHIANNQTDNKLQEKYNTAVQIIEELKNRHQLLSAKMYAESKLDEIGLRDNNAARNTLAEAIKRDPSKKSIDEAIAFLAPVRGMKVKKNVLTGAITESVVSRLPDNANSGAELALRLSNKLSYSRSR